MSVNPPEEIYAGNQGYAKPSILFLRPLSEKFTVMELQNPKQQQRTEYPK